MSILAGLSRRALQGLAVVLATGGPVAEPALSAQEDEELKRHRNITEGPVRPAEDPAAPRRHFRVPNPANISDADALAAYTQLRSAMVKGYALSGDPVARDYTSWRIYNTAPYKSAGHGRRFLNTYGNAAAAAYGKYEKAGKFPVGAILAKDSMAITEGGGVNAGPLFLMEKMKTGFNHVSGDWRYTMIMPDGSIFGITNGDGSKRVEFCVPCHLAAERHDHLHFLPEKYRLK